jgi:hypothetical protein
VQGCREFPTTQPWKCLQKHLIGQWRESFGPMSKRVLRNPDSPPWFCEWVELSELVAPEIAPEQPPTGDIVLTYVADRPPLPGDIIARSGSHVLVVIGPRRSSDSSDTRDWFARSAA